MMLSRLGKEIGAFFRDEQGAAAIEYGVIAAGIFLAISAIVFQLGSTLSGEYSNVDQSLKDQ
jgi:pilus assembly protein Flp/PilA